MVWPRNLQNPQTIGWQVPTSHYQHPRLCGTIQNQFYEQVKGAAMGSLVSPIVANLYMEYLEQKALSTAPNPLRSGTGM